MENYSEALFFVLHSVAIVFVGTIMYKHYKKRMLNFDKNESKIKFNFLKLYKNYAIILIIFSSLCIVIAVFTILYSLSSDD
jgi:membrane protein YqaA with SNARE-associated domain